MGWVGPNRMEKLRILNDSSKSCGKTMEKFLKSVKSTRGNPMKSTSVFVWDNIKNELKMNFFRGKK